MTKFHDQIYEIAKLDYKSANILAENRMFPQSIYFYEQCFEKNLKAVIAQNLSCVSKKTDFQIEKKLRPNGHNVIEKTMEMMKLLIKPEVQLYVSRGGKIKDPFVQGTYDKINEFVEHETPTDHHVVRFFHVVEGTYHDFYKRLYAAKNDSKEWGWQYLRKEFSKPEKEHLKFMTLSWIVSPLLKNMDVLTRYPDPTKPLNNNNVKILMDSDNSNACDRLKEMLEDHIKLVPLVWEAANKLKK
jgi:hypothetical protein